MENINIAIFASGSGSNAEQIINYFKSEEYLNRVAASRGEKRIELSFVLSNRGDAKVLKRAENLGVESIIMEREEFEREGALLLLLKRRAVHYIVLAGFLLKIPLCVVEEYSNKILNIHPALLPKYGGRGMYGINIHRAVIEAEENESGITIHLVDGEYDTGPKLFQAKCPIEKGESAESLAQKVHHLEWKHYPYQIYRYIIDRERRKK
ncbi:MAG: phosphoribosylglycinamide formyltransferase [Bacteroidales bacterium]